MKKRPIKILWYGSDVDANGNPIIPEISPDFERRLEGLNEGEIYIHNDDSNPGIYIRTNRDRVVAISGAGNINELAQYFIRKNQNDETNYLLSLLGGTIIKKSAKFGDFYTGISGGYVDEKGDMEMNSGVFRKRLFVPEIAYNRITYFKGRMVLSPGGGCTVLSYVDNGDGTYTITPDLTDADGLSQFVDDILTTYFVTKNAEGKLNGFEEMKFRVTAADYTAKKFTVIPRPGHAGWKPAEQMVLSQTGNFTDPERQTYILMDSVNGNNNITFFDNANTWDPEPAQMKAWLGKRKGMTIAGINADKYNAVLEDIIMSGLIFQVDQITGDMVRVPLDKGEWAAGQYGYYDRVSHNGALWLCVNDKGTTSEPLDSNPDWLKQVAEGQKGDKGDKGDPGLSVVGGGHWESSKTPYAANTMVSFANSVFLSKVETSNPPIRIFRVMGGRYLRKKDGGYILAGKSTDWEVNEDWEMLLDGRELKGESITFLGRFDAPPSNPIEGNSYYNTVDRATYIYHNGQWIMSVSDGKDGTDYEYIYQRGNSIGNPPTKPDSRQEDDYVPEGWTDNFLGVDAAHQVEWGCKRVKEDGKWSEFSNPAIVHRWSLDGENAIMADFDNEMVNCALTSDGNSVSSQSWKTTVSMWYGTEKMELDSITCTPDTNLLCATDKTTGEVTVSVSAGAALAATNTVKITVRATRKGQQYSRDLTFTVAGVRGGANGSDAVLYSVLTSVSSVIKDKNDRYSVASVSCKRMKTVGSVTSTTTDGELKYSIDGGAEFSLANNAEVPSSDYTNTLRFVFYVDGQIVDVETVPMLTDGKDGADGLSVVGGGHWELSGTPYKANTLVSFANCVFLSKIDTSNPPLAISRFKSGAYRRKKDGGYILAGSSFDWQVHPDWDMLLDGRELKGTSITFLGRFETAPTNPAEGNSYYNTLDKATYIYQNGRWMLMVSDGADGTDYEYIYTRNNTIGIVPDKPASEQIDDYVPSGWTDDFLGVDSDHQIEWGCKRTKKNGVWSEWSNPAIVHRWSKDGESNVLADLDNEMVNCALTFEGKSLTSQVWTTNVGMWYGLEELSLDSLDVSAPVGLTATASLGTKLVTVSVAANVSLSQTNNVTITLKATKSGQQYTRNLTFTVAGVRGGANGEPAVLYSLVPSVSVIKKNKNGEYIPTSVSCKRIKTVGVITSDTTDGELKYSLDGGAETVISNGTAISVSSFSTMVKFLFYVSGKLVDVETVPFLSDGTDGESIVSAGHWESANTPYSKNTVVHFVNASFLALATTSNPPIRISKFKGGRYRKKKDGGYILAGSSSGRTVNPEWQLMVAAPDPSASYWLDCPISAIHFTSTGTPSPSSFIVTLKQNIAGNVSACNEFYLVARRSVNGTDWQAHVGAMQNSQISVPAIAGYTQFAIRAYKTVSDANAWNDNYVAEKGVSISKDGATGETGATGAFPRDRGVWVAGQTYIWNADYRDKVIHVFDSVYYNFLVRNYGASVTAAPTSANGDSNWEAMNKFVNIATDTLFADGANVAGFMFKNQVLRSHATTFDEEKQKEVPNLILNGNTGYFHCVDADITGTIRAKDGYFAGELRSVTGSFRSLTCLDGSGNTVGTLTFTPSGQLSFDGDIYSQGTRDSRSLRFYASDVWVRGAFGARSRTVLKVEGTSGYFYSKGINKAPISISLSSAVSSSGTTYYRIPCYGLSGDYAGMPVDTVVFTRNTNIKYVYELDMPESQRVTLINAQDNYNNISIFANGIAFDLNGGCACMVQNIYSLMTPKPTNKIGAGLIIIGGIHDNNWR